MSASVLARVALVAVVAVAGAIVLSSRGDDEYIAKLGLRNAAGLKDGSPVNVGGIRVGQVDVEIDTDRDVVVAELKLDEEHAPLGRDATAAIVTQNLLGRKSVNLTPGDPEHPVPSGTLIPPNRITTATDLDQVLNVLDADTRTRLAIFINEAGAAFTGRRADFNRFLRDVAPAVADGTDLLRELGRENAKLRTLLSESDRFVAEMTQRRDDVVRAVETFGEAALVSAGKRGELRETLAQAPGALRTLRVFLAQLRKTTKPLGPAARRLSEAAPPLRAALDQIEPFRKSAAPALRTAQQVAPTLERLASRATPVLRAAGPTAARLRTTVVSEVPPISDTLNRSFDNILGVLENWARAIQFRDNLSHVFRGEASYAPDMLVSVIERLANLRPPSKARKRERGKAPAGTPNAPVVRIPPVQRAKPLRLPRLPELRLPKAGRPVQGATEPVRQLLDFLLR